jgi:membrane protein implicated in regulation of membrane protease activity
MLFRRIYFLFHDERATRRIIAELEEKLGLEDYQLHALVNGESGFVQLPDATVQRKSPGAARFERFLWYLSIVLFAVSLSAFVLALLAASWLWVLLFAIVVVAAQMSGYLFTNRIPNAQLDRFRSALDHGEILLLVDVPYKRVREVKDFIYSRYPDTRTNGANWHINAFGM